MDSCFIQYVCDRLQLQYSTDGVSWLTVVPDSPYHYNVVLSSVSYYRWHVVSGLLDSLKKIIQFRFWFRTDDYNNYDGAGIDDIHIYENRFSIYDDSTSGFTVEKPVGGGEEWIDFLQDGQVVASIQPHNQNLGTVKVQTFIHKGNPPNFHGQYYLNRSFTIKAEQAPSDSIGVRLYFPDSGSDSLLFAMDCPSCTKPANAYHFGISTYTTTNAKEENDSISDNQTGEWSFIDSSQSQIVPFGKGYYSEFQVKHLSEFYFNNGGLDVNLISPSKSILPRKNQRLPQQVFTGRRLQKSTLIILTSNWQEEIQRLNKSFLQRLEP